MLKIVFDKRAGQPIVMAKGSIPEILNELTAAVGGIYRHMKEVDPEAAEFFKVAFSLCVDANEGAAWSREDESVGIAFRSQ